MEIERLSSILVHISSLPSSYGIGDFGPEAYKFIDFLVETRQKIWQILPITPTNSPSPYSNGTWADWPDSLRRHQSSALDDIRQQQKDRIQYHLFVQYVFHQQRFELKKYANDHHIKIVGDMPIYIDYDSVDVWAHADLFQLDENTMKPTWIERLRYALTSVDLLRIDHFRGLESHYVIPVDITTQKPKMSEAKWVKTPGDEFFTAVTRALDDDVPLIIEDIGALTAQVFELRDRFKLHGIRIGQKGFKFDADNMYAPHNYIPRLVAYTSSHDNPTVIQWWTKEASSQEKHHFIDYIRRPIEGQNETIDGLTLEKHVDKHICWYLIQLIMQSASNVAIIQMQDILNVETRMNEPGSTSDMDHDGPQNWSWRFQWSQLTSDIRKRLKTFTQMYGRDLKHGKCVPPEDMVMKDSKCLIQ
ncbi:unnamed protein product [Rotaria sp. Silwood2]|nr:unnamed protein product [Rotaria sp. Silwood2]